MSDLPFTDNNELPETGKASGNGVDPVATPSGNGHDPNAAVGPTVRFTGFKSNRRLTKSYKHDRNGGVATESGTQFSSGGYYVCDIPASGVTMGEILTVVGGVIDRLKSKEAIGLGVPKNGVQSGAIVVKDKVKSNPGAIARSLDYFKWPDLGLLFLDGDGIDGLFELVTGLYPDFAKVAVVVRPSASASVINPATGERLKIGEHLYAIIDDPSLSDACLDAVMRLAWVKGRGWLMLSKRGDTLVRGPIDASVGSPERLSYEGAIEIEDGLARLPRISTVGGGSGMLCAKDLIEFAKVNAPEKIYEAAVAKAKADPEFVARKLAAQLAYRGEHVKKAVARGIPREKAEKAYDACIATGSRTVGTRTWCPLTDEHVLFTPGGKEFTIADIRKDPLKYHGTECADPIEGLSYTTRNPAVIYTDGGRIEIYSRAHGDAYAYVAPLDDPSLSFAELLKLAGKKKSSAGVETFDDLPIDLKKLIASPPYPGENPDKTIGSATFRLFALGWSDAAIKALFEDYPDGIGAYFKDGAKDPGGEIAALRERFIESGNQQRADIITDINAHHALVLAGNKTAIMKFEGATRFRLLQVDSFKQWFGNELVQVGDKVTTAGKYWLGHPKRRQYEGIEFEPAGGRRGFYNLWQGFAVQARGGDCSKFLAHIRDNVAQGDEATYLWILGWWAQIFQQPALKMETALVLRGGFGAGKTKVGKVFGSLLSEHYLLVSSPRYITGQFNSHMKSLLVLHADEAFWAGDKKSEGTLKDLVSGDTHMLEYKGVDAIAIKNFIRLFVTGNLDWMVPVGFKDRRWAVFDIGEGKMQDHAYFAAIDEEMDNGGREALLHYLLNFDLSQVNLRVVPKTAAFLEQQIESMSAEQSWWMDTLMEGVLPKPAGCNQTGLCLKQGLYVRYVTHAKDQGAVHRSSQTKLGMFLHKQLGGELKTVRATTNGDRPWCFKFPSLEKCRELFAKALGKPVDWGENWDADGWRYEDWHTGVTFGDWSVRPG